MSQLDGPDIVYVARVAVPKLIERRVAIGTRFCTKPASQGKVLLAEMDQDEVAEGLSHPIRLPGGVGAAAALQAVDGRFVFGYGNIHAGPREWTIAPEFQDFLDRCIPRSSGQLGDDMLGFQLAFTGAGSLSIDAALLSAVGASYAMVAEPGPWIGLAVVVLAAAAPIPFIAMIRKNRAPL